MKKIFKLFGIAAVVALAASCVKAEYKEYPYVTFTTTSASVFEDCGTVSMAIKGHNLDNKSTTVTLQLVSGTAKEGVNATLTSPTVTVTGDQEVTVSVKVTDLPGTYTGNLACSVKITGATDDVQVGSYDTFSLAIKDNDHPLAAIIGTYTSTDVASEIASRASYMTSMEVEIYANPKNVTSVLIGGLDPYLGSYGYTYANGVYVVGNVNDDKTEITVADGSAFYSYTFRAWDGLTLATSSAYAPLKISVLGNGKLKVENGYGIQAASGGYYNRIIGGFTLNKQ